MILKIWPYGVHDVIVNINIDIYTRLGAHACGIGNDVDVNVHEATVMQKFYVNVDFSL